MRKQQKTNILEQAHQSRLIC